MSKICSDSNCLFSPEREWPFGTSRNIGSVCDDCSRSRSRSRSSKRKRKSLSTPSQSPSPKRQDVLTLNTSPGQPRTPQASPFDCILNTPQPDTPGTPQQPMASLSHFVVGLPPVSCKQDPPVSCKQDPFVDEQFVPSATPNGLAPPIGSPAAMIVDRQPLNLLATGSSSAGSPVAASPSAASPVAASPSAGSPVATCLFTGCLISFFDTEAEVGAGSTPFGGHQ
jgi:hypothetical protein